MEKLCLLWYKNIGFNYEVCGEDICHFRVVGNQDVVLKYFFLPKYYKCKGNQIKVSLFSFGISVLKVTLNR